MPNDSTPPGGTNRWWPHIRGLLQSQTCAMLIVLFGVLLRVWNIGTEFYQDELFSVQAASASLAHVLQVAQEDSPHPPFHLVLLHLWMRLWGSSEVSARALSVLASALFLPLLYRLALRWMCASAALIVLFLCAVSPFFVYYGQQARPYALATLLSTCSVYLWEKSQDEPAQRLYPILYGGSCAAVVYTQYMGVFILVPPLVAVAFAPSRAPRTLLLYGLGGMLAIIPWLLVVGGHLHPHALDEKFGWIPRPTLFHLARFFVDILGPLPIRGSTSVFVLLSALVISPISVKPGPSVRPPFVLLASLAFCGPIVAFLLSRSSPLSLWAARQLIGPALFFVVLLGFGLSRHRRWLGGLLASLLVLWAAAALAAELPHQRHIPWRAIVHFVQQHCPDCDVVMEEASWNFTDALRYYSHKDVHDAEAYTRRGDTTKPVAFLCRPVHCDRLHDIASHRQLIASQRMHWKTQATPYTTMQIYLFAPSP